MRKSVLALVIVAIFVVFAPNAFAQSPDSKSHWAVSASIVPSWKTPKFLEIVYDSKKLDVSGSEFEVGIGRGRAQGGDWNVSYIQTSYKDGSTVTRGGSNSICFATGICGTFGTSLDVGAVSLKGIMVQKFVPFVTIKRRVQIGVNFGGGAAWVKGNVVKTDTSAEPVFTSGRITGVLQHTTVTTLPGSEAFISGLKTLPLAKAEVAVAGIITPNLKVRVSGGLSLPGQHMFGVHVVYFIGS